MPSISHHWVRLTDQHLSLIIDGPPDQEEENDDDCEPGATEPSAAGHRPTIVNS